MNKIFLCGITYAPAICDVAKNIIPISKHFSGLNWVVNTKSDALCGEEKALLNMLEENKGEGFISNQKWINNYSFSRNRYLFDPCMDSGDFFVVVDSLEKINESFVENQIPEICQAMVNQNIDAVFLHGKLFIARKNDFMEYKNAVHEQLTGFNNAVELTNLEQFNDSSKYFTNTRPQVRGEYHWVRHFANYYVISPIQCLMGAEGNQQLYMGRVRNREAFKYICKGLGINWNVNDILSFWQSKSKDSLSVDMVECINNEKILNNLYRYEIMKDRDLVADWDWSNIKKI